MTKGRKPKPTSIKKIQGTYRPDRANPNEPIFPVPGRMLAAPDFLTGTAADVWRRLGKLLLEVGLFTRGDYYALAMLSLYIGRGIDAERELVNADLVLTGISKNGNEYQYQNPLLSISNYAWEAARKMFGEFGLTPAERTRLKAVIADREKSLADKLFEAVRIDGDG